MKKITAILGFIFCFTIISCKEGKAQTYQFNDTQLLERVKVLSSDDFKGRKAGEQSSTLAQDYIIKQFKDLGVAGFNNKYKQHFTFSRQDKVINATNILAEIKGSEFPEKYIVISAHYDHLGVSNETIYNGADDNASGVSAMVSFAEYLVKNPPKHSVIFAAFDAEELGLKGAKHFVNTIDKDKVLVNLNMDMISRSSKNELYVVGTRYNDALKKIIEAFKNPTDSKLIQGHDGTDDKQNWTMSSDHGLFHLKKIPFLYFGNEDHKAYHQPTDDFEDITPEFYKNAVTIILNIFKAIDDTGLN
ncbi:M28 family peptidase [Ichthyenterobacterium sp. W332]|uniref:M28 family peptidase n=1 Tax=Microcosmobacter mediterraneus TaxID=3075607 RepID=A0ABU2YKI2_9FLAO|nr:M28 family peptidase [Ichthyenterobacterium sp. W332]MDT0558567.1 M28 family peptidase [Ichthyenterobacterium sp. W332]